MVTISNVVKHILTKNVFLQEAIDHGIVSFNKLAMELKPEIEDALGKKVKTNSIVMALRRYSEKLETKETEAPFNYFRETLLKSDVCYIIVEDSPSCLNKIQNLYNNIDFKRGGIFNIIQGNYEVGIITNQRHKNKLLDLLSEEKILNVLEDLVVISLTYSRDYLQTPGVMYNVLRFLAWENINVVSIILTQKELSLLIARDDTTRCYETLDRLVKPIGEVAKKKK